MSFHEGMLCYDCQSETFFVTTFDFIRSTCIDLGIADDVLFFWALTDDDRQCLCMNRIPCLT